MKNLQKFSLLLLITLISISCSSSDDDNPTGGDAFLTAKVAGTDFASMDVSVSATVTSTILVVQGSNAGGDFIRFNISSYNGVGTYNTGDNLTNTNSIMYGTITPVASWTSTFNIGNGTIEITEDSATHVKGTFSFLGYNGSTDRKEITEGNFSAPKN